MIVRRAGARECRVLLLRHGRTALNREGRFRGREDPPLDAEGRAEARRAADLLAGLRPEALYTSPLRRARQTAEPLARRCGIRVRPEPALIDLDYGTWTGWTPREAAASDPERYRRFRRDPEHTTLPDGEAVRAVAERVEGLLRRLGAGHPGRTIVVVTHDVPIRLVVARARGRHGPAMWRGEVPTGSVTPLGADARSLRVLGRTVVPSDTAERAATARPSPAPRPRRPTARRRSRAGPAPPRRGPGSRPGSSRR